MQPTKKVVFCVPTMIKPFQVMLDSLEASMPEIDAAGWESGMVSEVGSPYISGARAEMLRKALKAGATDIVFIDQDVSWPVGTMAKLLATKGDVVAGTYRFKIDEEKYMGSPLGTDYPTVRADGCVKMAMIPAGFLKITTACVDKLRKAYPELIYGPDGLDLFNHGAFDGAWWGEDFAFCRRWLAIGGEIWCIPTLKLTHHTTEKAYPGNYHEYLRRSPGGDLSDAPDFPGLGARRFDDYMFEVHRPRPTYQQPEVRI